MLQFGKLYRYNVDLSKPPSMLNNSSVKGGHGSLLTFTNRNELLVPIAYENYVINKDEKIACWVKVLRGNGQVVWMFARPALFEEVSEI